MHSRQKAKKSIKIYLTNRKNNIHLVQIEKQKKQITMNIPIYQFVHNRKGQIVGCVAATGRGKVGWSLCNTSKGDVFNKQTALEIAAGRANTGKYHYTNAPHSVRKLVQYFELDRSLRYFKK